MDENKKNAFRERVEAERRARQEVFRAFAEYDRNHPLPPPVSPYAPIIHPMLYRAIVLGLLVGTIVLFDQFWR